MKKIKKNFGFGAILVSFIFIFNPNIHLIDLLPDAIGYLLLCLGLSQLADMNDYAQDALKLFRRLFFLQCVKLGSLFWVFVVVNIDDRASSILTFTFVFSMLEILLLIPAYGKLFSSIDYLAQRGGYEINTQKVKSFTTFFLISKGVFNVLPELAALAQYKDENANTSSVFYHVDWFGNIDLLRGFAFIPALIISIIWLIKCIRTIKKIRKDKDFIGYLKDKYVTEILPKTELFLKKSTNFAFLTFSLGIVLSVDFFIGISTGEMTEVYTINLIPDVFSVICVLCGLWGLREYIPKTKKTATVASIIYAAVTTAKECIATEFFKKHTILDLRIDMEANHDYTFVKLAAIIEAISFAAFVFTIILVLREIIKNHTGYAPITENASENQNTQDKVAYIHKTLNTKVNVLLLFGVICALFNVLYYFMLPFWDFTWIVNFSVSSVFAIVFVLSLFSISDEIDYKYMI